MNFKLIIEKIDQGKIRFLVRVFVVAIIFSITLFLIFLDINKEYKASVSILVIAKNETSAVQINRIIWNVAEFPKMFSFYERLIKSNPRNNDDFNGKTKDEIKKLWNKKVETDIEKNKKDSIINLFVFSETSTEAKELIVRATKNLLEFSSGYYNAKEEVELRVIDGPFIEAVSRNNLQVFLVSIFTGTLASLILNLALSSIEKVFSSLKSFTKTSGNKKIGEFVLNQKQEDFLIKKVEDRYVDDVPYIFEKENDNEEFEIEKEQIWNKEEEIELESILKNNPYPNYPEMPTTPRSASAPDNLPIAEGFDEEVFIPKEPEFMEMKKHEPTDEELKERLNKLLRGEL